MYTPLDIENKKFAKQMMNGYSVEEVDNFLDELTADYEKLYKESNESKGKISELESSLVKYKNLETTLQNTLVMAQSTADEIKKVAKQESEQIIRDAQATAKNQLMELEQQISAKTREFDELRKQFDVYKAKMESLLISHLDLIKDVHKDD